MEQQVDGDHRRRETSVLGQGTDAWHPEDRGFGQATDALRRFPNALRQWQGKIRCARARLAEIRTISELIDAISVRFLEGIASVLLLYWLLSPVLVMFGQVFLKHEDVWDAMFSQSVATIRWQEILQQAGLIGWMVGFVRLAKSLREWFGRKALESSDNTDTSGITVPSVNPGRSDNHESTARRISGKRTAWLRAHAFEWLFLLLLGWSALSALFADNREIAWFGTQYRQEGLRTYLMYGGVLCLGLAIRTPKAVLRLLRALTGVSVLQAVLVLVDFAPLSKILAIGPQTSVFFNSNHYGYYLVIAIMSTLLLHLIEPELEAGSGKSGNMARATSSIRSSDQARATGSIRSGNASRATGSGPFNVLYRNRYLAAFLIQTAALVQNQSLGPFLAVCGGLGAMLLGMRWLDRSRLKTMGQATGLFTGVTVIMNVFTRYLATDLVRLFGDLGLILRNAPKSGGAGSGRWTLWVNGIRFIGEKPLFGYGPDNLGARYLLENIQIDRPHNEPIQIAASLGIPALLFYLGALLVLALAFWRSRSRLGTSGIALAGIIIAYLVSSLFGNTMFYTTPYFLIILGLARTRLRQR